MNSPPFPPAGITGGPLVKVQRKILESIPCPKCYKTIDVSDVRAGANVKCYICGNITPVPESKSRWWFKTGNFIIAILASIIGSIVVWTLLSSR